MTSANSTKTVYVSLSFVILIVAVIAVLSVRSGYSGTQEKQRALVIFTHEAHAEYASECKDCHHKYENDDYTNNILDESELEDNYPDENVVLNMKREGDPGQVKCASCHTDKAKTVTKDAFHKQCIGCHETGGGPLMCGECHVNTNTASDGE